jgi:hypothetical protein
MRRKPPSIGKAVVGQAKAVDLNLSRTAEAAAVDAYAREIDREGLGLSRFRSF